MAAARYRCEVVGDAVYAARPVRTPFVTSSTASTKAASVWIRTAVSPDHFVIDENSLSQPFQVLANDFCQYYYTY